MKHLASIACISAAFIFASCGSGDNRSTTDSLDGDTAVTQNLPEETPIARANLFETNDNSKSLGIVNFYDAGNGQIKMDLQINYPARADSNVAVHFHEHGDCGNMGENAHGHWNPTSVNHGQWGVDPFHSGDIGNITLNNEGKGSKMLTTDLWSISDTDKNNIIGLSVIVHGGTDDYKSQPAGNSGPRVGCGVIEKL